MSITFTASPFSITIDSPMQGYTVEVAMPLHITQLLNGKIKSWDDGATYDRRVLKFKTMLPESQHADVMDFFFDTNKGRCQNVTMSLGASPTGFYPAGPDKGDTGDFVIWPVSVTTGQILQQPWLHFSDEMEFLIVSSPSYTLPSTTGFSQGDFTLGSVSGLMQPQTGFNPETTMALVKQKTMGGSGGYVDRGYASDKYRSSFSLQANQPKMAELINHMVTAVRGATFNIVNQNNLYPFGGHFGDTWTSYTARLSTGSLVIGHSEQQFDATFNMSYESAT